MNPPTLSWITKHIDAVWPKVYPYANVEITEDVLRRLVSEAVLCYGPKSGIDNDAVAAAYCSMEHLRGQIPGPKMLRANMHRLAANWHIIRDGMQIPVWDGELCCADVIILGIRINPPGPGRMTYTLRLKIRNSIAAGMEADTVVTDACIMRFLKYLAGVSKLETTCEDISGMQAQISFMMPSNRFIVNEWNTTDGEKEYNRSLVNARRDPSKCALPRTCNLCALTTADCPLAVWLP